MDACASCRRLLAELARTSFALTSADVSSIDEADEEDRPTDPDLSRQEGLRGGQVVAGRYRVSENIPGDLKGYPVQIYLDDKVLRIEKI